MGKTAAFPSVVGTRGIVVRARTVGRSLAHFEMQVPCMSMCVGRGAGCIGVTGGITISAITTYAITISAVVLGASGSPAV